MNKISKKGKILAFIKKETVLSIAGLLAIFSAFFVPPAFSYLPYLDFRVLALLFSLMGVMAGFQDTGIFSRLALSMLKETKGTRQLTAALVSLCFFSSMAVTNDVSLITFIPFTILVLKMAGEEKLMIRIIVLQTIAANLGSMLTPIGNPQNLYLHSLSGMSALQFAKTMTPYTVLSFLLLCLVIFLTPAANIHLENMAGELKPISKKEVAQYSILFLLCLATVVHLIPYPITFLAVLLVLGCLHRDILKKIDYFLLLTFIFFFIFIGNMGEIPAVRDGLQQVIWGRELELSVLASQVISNVPAAILLSGFTEDYASLLVGVNLGGLGTLIASLASLISYKYYVRQPGSKKLSYLIHFTAMNVLFLAVLYLAAKI